jgi:hypothetical protein
MELRRLSSPEYSTTPTGGIKEPETVNHPAVAPVYIRRYKNSGAAYLNWGISGISWNIWVEKIFHTQILEYAS